MRAKSFFYVSVGIFLLALSYHLGATLAKAQSGGTVNAAMVGGAVVAVADRTFMIWDGTQVTSSPHSIPGSSPAVATGSTFGSNAFAVVLANGDIYSASASVGGNAGTMGPWILSSNLFGGAPVSGSRQSWGQLKARYR